MGVRDDRARVRAGGRELTALSVADFATEGEPDEPAVPGEMDPRDDALSLHRRFGSARIRGEWFNPTPELLAYIGSVKETSS